MKLLKILFSTLIIGVLLLQSCGNDKSETNTGKEVSVQSKKSVKKKTKKKDKAKKNTTVIVEATIDGEKIVFGNVDPKYNSVVVLFNDFIQLKYTDIKNQAVLVHLYDANIYKSTPNSFTQQIAALPRKEQVLGKVKGSKLSILKTNMEQKTLNLYISELYQGEVFLKEFTEDKIVINFKGKGFSVGVNNAKSNLFPMEGKIIIENYNIYDAR